MSSEKMQRFVYFMCINVLLHDCLGTTGILGVVLELELELWPVMSSNVGAGSQTLIFFENKCS